MDCPKCGGTGKLEKAVSNTSMGEVDCDMCEGTGQLYEDLMPQLIARLDRIVELLERITGGK